VSVENKSHGSLSNGATVLEGSAYVDLGDI
jgi:hypothetical protein